MGRVVISTTEKLLRAMGNLVNLQAHRSHIDQRMSVLSKEINELMGNLLPEELDAIDILYKYKAKFQKKDEQNEGEETDE